MQQVSTGFSGIRDWARNRSANKAVSGISTAFFWLFPAALGLFVMGSIVHERVLAMSWEFAEYGSIARNVDRGMGAVSNAFEPYDLVPLKNTLPRPRPPIILHNRTLLPIWLTSASVALLGPSDFAVTLPNILAFVALLLLTGFLERQALPETGIPLAATLVASTPVVFHSAL